MGYLKIISAILIWSSLGIFVRKSGLTITGVIFYPAVIAALFQLVLLLTRNQLIPTKGSERSTKNMSLLLLIPICFVANSFFFYYAFTHTTIANAVLTHYTAPIFVAFMAPVFLKERIMKTAWFAITLSSIGLWVMLDGISFGSLQWNGIAAGVTSGLAYAFLILIIRGIASKYPSLFIIFIQNAFVSLMLLPFALKIHLSITSLPYVVFMGIVHSTIAPLLYVQGIKSVRAHEAAILGYFEPIGAIILALLFLHEVPGMKELLGGVLILYSGFMIIKNKRIKNYE
jgi:drug/metabolite transporter (DMT)-like permease